MLSNKALSVNDSDTDTERPVVQKVKGTKKPLKKPEFDEQEIEEEETEPKRNNQKDEEVEEEEQSEDEIYDFEMPSSGKFNATSVVYDNNKDYQRLQSAPKNKYGDLANLRPATMLSNPNDEIYDIATASIENKRLRRENLANDPVYRFFIQVAGHANTLASNFGLPSIGNIGTGGGGRGRMSVQSSPITSGQINTAPPSPAKGVGSGASFAGRVLTNREKLERLAYEKRLAEFENDVNIPVATRARVKQDLVDSEATERENALLNQKKDLISATLAWMDKDDITGFSEIRPIMYACINAAHLAIVSSMPEWENVDVMDFINDTKMSILFAEIVAIHITIRRNFNSTSVSLDKSLARAYSWLSSRMDQLHRWRYDDPPQNDNGDHFVLNARINTYYIPPGAPPRHRHQNSSSPSSYRIPGRIGSFSHNFFG